MYDSRTSHRVICTAEKTGYACFLVSVIWSKRLAVRLTLCQCDLSAWSPTFECAPLFRLLKEYASWECEENGFPWELYDKAMRETWALFGHNYFLRQLLTSKCVMPPKLCELCRWETESAVAVKHFKNCQKSNRNVLCKKLLLAFLGDCTIRQCVKLEHCWTQFNCNHLYCLRADEFSRVAVLEALLDDRAEVRQQAFLAFRAHFTRFE